MFRRLLFSDNRKPGKKKVIVSKPPDGYIEKYDLKGHPVVVVTDFEPGVFKLLIDYIHTGSVMLQARSLLGLMNAADHYCLEDLKLSCIRFMEHCITIDTVCSLLASAEKYIQYKSTKILVQKMFEFVDVNAEKILSLGAFQQLPQHVVRIVLGRDELQAREVTKFNAAYRWTLRYVEEHSEVSMMEGFEPFVDVIDFVGIPAKELMQNVRRAEVVEDRVILNALATQADPTNVPPEGGGVRAVPRLRKTATVPSDMEGRSRTSATPSPPQGTRRGEREMRRGQSTNQCLTHVIDTRGGDTPPPNEGWKRDSVPSPDAAGTRIRPKQNGTGTHPILESDEIHARSSPPNTPSSGSRSNSRHGSGVSFVMDGDVPVLTSSPVGQQRQLLSYNTLDMIVTASNPDNTPVNV